MVAHCVWETVGGRVNPVVLFVPDQQIDPLQFCFVFFVFFFLLLVAFAGSLSSLCFCKNGFWSSSFSLPLSPSLPFSLLSLLSHLSLSRRKQVINSPHLSLSLSSPSISILIAIALSSNLNHTHLRFLTPFAFLQVPIASDTEENHFSVVILRSHSSHTTVLASKVRIQNSELVVSLISFFFMFSPLNLDSWLPAVWRIRAFLYTGFLSDDECDHLINLVSTSSVFLFWIRVKNPKTCN